MIKISRYIEGYKSCWVVCSVQCQLYCISFRINVTDLKSVCILNMCVCVCVCITQGGRSQGSSSKAILLLTVNLMNKIVVSSQKIISFANDFPFNTYSTLGGEILKYEIIKPQKSVK